MDSLKGLSAGKLKKMGNHARRLNDPYNAIDVYSAYLSKKKNYKIHLRLAEMHIATRNYREAYRTFVRIQSQYPDKHDILLYEKALVEKNLGLYDKASADLGKFRNEYKGKDKNYYRKRAKIEIEGCELALNPEQDSVIYSIEHLNGDVNMAHIEFSPLPYAKNLMVFGSLKSNKEIFYSDIDRPKRNIYLAQKKGKKWQTVGPLFKALGVPGEIGNVTISQDKQTMYCSVCNPNWQNKMICTIYRLKKNGKAWGKPLALNDEVNQAKYTSTQPTIGIRSKKQREVLYFVSDRPGGKGKLDIWYSEFDPKKNEFKKPRNAGSKVNGTEDESTPFFHFGTHKLYYSSESHPGFGGMDVFWSFGERSKWTKAKNIGKAFNSNFDELYYTTDESGDMGYFVSNRDGTIPLKSEHCCDDIFSFERKALNEIELELIVEKTRLTEYPPDDDLIDQDDIKPVEDGLDIDLYIIDEDEEEVFVKSIPTNGGLILTELEPGFRYKIKVDEPNYLLEEFKLPPTTGKTKITENILIKMIPLAEVVVPNIYYPFDEYYLTKDAQVAIDTTILEILNDNPSIIVEIGSHTDSKGSVPYNNNLSNNRAQSVVNYLRKNGIDKDRLKYKGYGEGSPLVPNEKPDGTDDPEGRAKNRRTSFKVIGRLVNGEKVLYDQNFKGIKKDR